MHSSSSNHGKVLHVQHFLFYGEDITHTRGVQATLARVRAIRGRLSANIDLIPQRPAQNTFIFNRS